MANEDMRFNFGLIADVWRVLENHDYRPTGHPADTGRATLRLLQLVEAFEGRDSRDA